MIHPVDLRGAHAEPSSGTHNRTHGDESIVDRRPKEIESEMGGEAVPVLGKECEGGVSAGTIGDGGNDAGMKKAVLLSEAVIPASDRATCPGANASTCTPRVDNIAWRSMLRRIRASPLASRQEEVCGTLMSVSLFHLVRPPRGPSLGFNGVNGVSLCWARASRLRPRRKQEWWSDRSRSHTVNSGPTLLEADAPRSGMRRGRPRERRTLCRRIDHHRRNRAA